MSDDHAGYAPSLDDLAEIAERAFAALPSAFRDLAGEVVIRVDDFPSDDILKEMEIDSPFDLTGLYSQASNSLQADTARAQGFPNDVLAFRSNLPAVTVH